MNLIKINRAKIILKINYKLKKNSNKFIKNNEI